MPIKDQSIYTNSQPKGGVSENLQQFIDAMVEEIVLEGKPFDTQKKYLRKFSENEGLDYEAIENGITELVETLREMKSTDSKLLMKLALIQAKEACVTEAEVLKIVELMDKKEDGFQSVECEYVDLGLPSGTLWATCNIGANKPEDYGDYFAWGEIQPKTEYDGDTYKHGKRKKRLFTDELFYTKYCNKSNYGYNGFTDNLTTLEPSDDAATANWGGDWCMPTKEQWEELLQNITNKLTTQNGVQGMLFTAKNGQTLFLPAAGLRWVDELNLVGSYGDYWSSSLYTDYPNNAWYFSFRSNYYGMGSNDRSNGLSVRAVRSARQN